jgi:hypothetical protein
VIDQRSRQGHLYNGKRALIELYLRQHTGWADNRIANTLVCSKNTVEAAPGGAGFHVVKLTTWTECSAGRWSRFWRIQ